MYIWNMNSWIIPIFLNIHSGYERGYTKIHVLYRSLSLWTLWSLVGMKSIRFFHQFIQGWIQGRANTNQGGSLFDKLAFAVYVSFATNPIHSNTVIFFHSVVIFKTRFDVHFGLMILGVFYSKSIDFYVVNWILNIYLKQFSCSKFDGYLCKECECLNNINDFYTFI